MKGQFIVEWRSGSHDFTSYENRCRIPKEKQSVQQLKPAHFSPGDNGVGKRKTLGHYSSPREVITGNQTGRGVLLGNMDHPLHAFRKYPIISLYYLVVRTARR